MGKPDFCICENKDADQLRSNCAADQRLCFLIRIVHALYYLNPKFQASSHLLWLYRPVCVGPGRKPRRPVFLQRGSFDNRIGCSTCLLSPSGTSRSLVIIEIHEKRQILIIGTSHKVNGDISQLN